MKNVDGKHPSLRILVLIANADKSTSIAKLLSRLPSHIQHQFHADGTASSEILDILGLGAVEKIVTVCMLPAFHVESLLKGVFDDLSLHLPGKGIAFTIPVSGITERALTLINSETDQTATNSDENEVKNMEINIGHHLIIAAVNQGYSESIADTARQAGATGGTVWSARKSGLEETMKILGVPTQEEQEIIAILATKDNKLEIMKALNEKHGVTSEARGIIFSLPVDSVIGMGVDNKKTLT